MFTAYPQDFLGSIFAKFGDDMGSVISFYQLQNTLVSRWIRLFRLRFMMRNLKKNNRQISLSSSQHFLLYPRNQFSITRKEGLHVDNDEYIVVHRLR